MAYSTPVESARIDVIIGAAAPTCEVKFSIEDAPPVAGDITMPQYTMGVAPKRKVGIYIEVLNNGGPAITAWTLSVKDPDGTEVANFDYPGNNGERDGLILLQDLEISNEETLWDVARFFRTPAGTNEYVFDLDCENEASATDTDQKKVGVAADITPPNDDGTVRIEFPDGHIVTKGVRSRRQTAGLLATLDKEERRGLGDVEAGDPSIIGGQAWVIREVCPPSDDQTAPVSGIKPLNYDEDGEYVAGATRPGAQTTIGGLDQRAYTNKAQEGGGDIGAVVRFKNLAEDVEGNETPGAVSTDIWFNRPLNPPSTVAIPAPSLGDTNGVPNLRANEYVYTNAAKALSPSQTVTHVAAFFDSRGLRFLTPDLPADGYRLGVVQADGKVAYRIPADLRSGELVRVRFRVSDGYDLSSWGTEEYTFIYFTDEEYTLSVEGDPGLTQFIDDGPITLLIGASDGRPLKSVQVRIGTEILTPEDAGDGTWELAVTEGVGTYLAFVAAEDLAGGSATATVYLTFMARLTNPSIPGQGPGAGPGGGGEDGGEIDPGQFGKPIIGEIKLRDANEDVLEPYKVTNDPMIKVIVTYRGGAPSRMKIWEGDAEPSAFVPFRRESDFTLTGEVGEHAVNVRIENGLGSSTGSASIILVLGIPVLFLEVYDNVSGKVKTFPSLTVGGDGPLKVNGEGLTPPMIRLRPIHPTGATTGAWKMLLLDSADATEWEVGSLGTKFTYLGGAPESTSNRKWVKLKTGKGRKTLVMEVTDENGKAVQLSAWVDIDKTQPAFPDPGVYIRDRETNSYLGTRDPIVNVQIVASADAVEAYVSPTDRFTDVSNPANWRPIVLHAGGSGYVDNVPLTPDADGILKCWVRIRTASGQEPLDQNGSPIVRHDTIQLIEDGDEPDISAVLLYDADPEPEDTTADAWAEQGYTNLVGPAGVHDGKIIVEVDVTPASARDWVNAVRVSEGVEFSGGWSGGGVAVGSSKVRFKVPTGIAASALIDRLVKDYYVQIRDWTKTEAHYKVSSSAARIIVDNISPHEGGANQVNLERAWETATVPLTIRKSGAQYLKVSSTGPDGATVVNSWTGGALDTFIAIDDDALDQDGWATTVTLAASVVSGTLVTVRFQLRDRAGNLSSVFTKTVYYDTDPLAAVENLREKNDKAQDGVWTNESGSFIFVWDALVDETLAYYEVWYTQADGTVTTDIVLTPESTLSGITENDIISVLVRGVRYGGFPGKDAVFVLKVDVTDPEVE